MIKMIMSIDNPLYRLICKALAISPKVSAAVTGVNYKSFLFPFYQVNIISVTLNLPGPWGNLL